MKQILLWVVALTLSLVAAQAAETVRAAQTRLKTEGFYHGATTGSYDSETAAAVTRYQIRHGLEISGKLDAATAQSLGIAAKNDVSAEPSPASGTWRRLRDGDMQFLKKVNAGAIPPPKPLAEAPAPETGEPGIDPHAPPPRLAEDIPGTVTGRASGAAQRDAERFAPERLRDYVAAFVLAGLDPAVGAELEFFADRVDYFGEEGVGRERIRRDLTRYDHEWPQRRFWLAGELKVERLPGEQAKVSFPLRYELGNGQRHKSGKVMKTLILHGNSAGQLEITGVTERKL